jgi:Na+-transporting NADH:ubiquinone oxidoreductase subunit NqrC
MQRLLLAISIIVSLCLAAILVVVLQQPQISTFEIDRDRSALSAEISTIQAESEKYESGLLKSLIEVRLAITRNTLAMLDQKRASFIRRITLNYQLDGQPIREASDQELNTILEELSQAEKKANASKLNAERYTGGLMQAMALMTAETDQLSVSQLRLKFYSAKHGIPMPFPSLPEKSKTPAEPPGKIVKDREAL